LKKRNGLAVEEAAKSSMAASFRDWHAILIWLTG
jgi:hypothetical protein